MEEKASNIQTQRKSELFLSSEFVCLSIDQYACDKYDLNA